MARPWINDHNRTSFGFAGPGCLLHLDSSAVFLNLFFEHRLLPTVYDLGQGKIDRFVKIPSVHDNFIVKGKNRRIPLGHVLMIDVTAFS